MPVVSDVGREWHKAGYRGEDRAARPDDATRVAKRSLEILQEAKRVRQQKAVVAGGGHDVGGRQVTQVRGMKGGVDVERVHRLRTAAISARVVGGLELQNAAANKRGACRQELVHVVPIDRRAPIEPIHLRQRSDTSKVSP